MGKEMEENKVDKTDDELRDEAWDALDEAEGTTPAPDGLSDKTDPEDEGNNAPAKTTPTDSDLLKGEPEHTESPEAKALKDTKAWATKLSQENAELKKLIAEGATKKEVAEQEKAVEQAKKGIDEETLNTVFTEYPELKPVLSTILETVKSVQQTTESITKDKEKAAEQAEERRKKEALDHFETKIMPEVMAGEDGHPDFKDIIGTSDYFEWAEQQRPGLRTAALMSNDPADIKFALSQYKRDRAKPEAAAMKRNEEQKKKEKIENLKTLRGGGSQLSQKSGGKDPNDYDAAWDEAERAEARK